MSELIRRLNLVKKRRNENWLTPSQRKAMATLRNELRMAGTINLVGRSGVGKTFLAWMLAEQSHFHYLTRASQLTNWKDASSIGVLIDNCVPSRTEHRSILSLLQRMEIPRAILITREIIPDYTRYYLLELTAEDLAHAHRNLTSLGLSIATTSAQHNLWSLLSPYFQGV